MSLGDILSRLLYVQKKGKKMIQRLVQSEPFRDLRLPEDYRFFKTMFFFHNAPRKI